MIQKLDNIAIEILNAPRNTEVTLPGTLSKARMDFSQDIIPFSDEILDKEKEWHLTAKPNYYKDSIKQYQFFNKWIYSPKRVFYPCSHTDASPIKGFPNAEVILMDTDDKVDYVMKKHKVSEFIQGDALEYVPENPFDLIIILNPSQKSSDLTKHLVKGGYVLANNWHNSAFELLEDSNYEGIGTIDKDEKGYFLARNFDKLEPEQFATYFYVFRNRGVKAA